MTCGTQGVEASMVLTLEMLASFPSQLSRLFEVFGTAEREWIPPSWAGVPSEPLSAIGHLCHCRDVEIDGYHDRLTRMLMENEPRLHSLDALELARKHDYASADPNSILAEFTQARRRTVTFVKGMDEGQLARKAFFEGYGLVTLRGLVHHLASHDQQHLAGMQWLLGTVAAHARAS